MRPDRDAGGSRWRVCAARLSAEERSGCEKQLDRILGTSTSPPLDTEGVPDVARGPM